MACSKKKQRRRIIIAACCLMIIYLAFKGFLLFSYGDTITVKQLSKNSLFISYTKDNEVQQCPNFRWSHTRITGLVNNSLLDLQGNFTSFISPTVGISSHGYQVALFPDEAPSDDRIVNQMLHVPGNLPSLNAEAKTKIILLWQGLGGKRSGATEFSKCPVSQCSLIDDRKASRCADAIIFYSHVGGYNLHKFNNRQIWIFFALESPSHLRVVNNKNALINWTATYRRDSTLVTPYFKFTLYDTNVKNITHRRNYAMGKTKKVAWFVSNCHTSNRRLQYARELSSYIEVDIFGSCGTKVCPRDNSKHCFDMLSRDYKFYLSFENSNCRDYITEKFFLNGLNNDVVPIVMGAPLEDYNKVAPAHSFIHIDQFNSARELALYLHRLDYDDFLYNQYFAWKGTGLVDTNTFFFCRLCTLLHEASQRKSSFLLDLEQWWTRDQCLPIGQQKWTQGKKVNTT